jgi:hypothetical protein
MPDQKVKAFDGGWDASLKFIRTSPFDRLIIAHNCSVGHIGYCWEVCGIALFRIGFVGPQGVLFQRRNNGFRGLSTAPNPCQELRGSPKRQSFRQRHPSVPSRGRMVGFGGVTGPLSFGSCGAERAPPEGLVCAGPLHRVC